LYLLLPFFFFNSKLLLFYTQQGKSNRATSTRYTLDNASDTVAENSYEEKICNQCSGNVSTSAYKDML